MLKNKIWGSMPGKIIPDELRFAVTRACNGICRHCYNESGQDSDSLPVDDYIEIIDTVKKINPHFDRITLTGGEPLLHKHKAVKIAEAAKVRGIKARLVTRGWELTLEVCEELKDAGVTRIQIGLDSSEQNIYIDENKITWDTFHGWLRGDPDGFRNAREGIRNSLAAGIDTSIRYSLAKSNFDDVVKTYDLVAAMGVSKFKLRILFPDGRAREELLSELVDGASFAQAQHDLIFASQGRNTIVEVTQPCLYPLPSRGELEQCASTYRAYREACTCGTTAAYIDSNGDVKYCLFDASVIGNVEEQGFIQVWNSAAAEKVREKRCPLDRSGTACSSFKILYEQFGDYSVFMEAYSERVRKLEKSLSLSVRSVRETGNSTA